MDALALWIGYVVLIVSGLAAMLLIAWLAAEAVWKFWVSGWNAADLMDAAAEWRQRHPGKYAQWKKRNGVMD